MKIKILIVGSSGFLGTNFLNFIKNFKKIEVHALVHKKKHIIVKNKKVKYILGNICKYNDLKKKLNCTYDFIFNFSGNINHKKNKETYNVHFKGIKNLVKIIKRENSTVLTQIGSSLEYGKKSSPHSEKNVCRPMSYYGKAKFLASNFIKLNLKNYVILRPYQIYGPYQKVDRLIPITIVSCLKNKAFLCSEGSQLRDFLFVDDFINLLVKIIKKKKIKSGIYNVGTGKPLKVKNIINLINTLTGKGRPLFGKLKMRKDEINEYYPRINKVKKNFDWEPKIDIHRGINKTIKYYKNNL